MLSSRPSGIADVKRQLISVARLAVEARATAEHAHATAARELEEEREASARLQG
jgi:hypothetical protein